MTAIQAAARIIQFNALNWVPRAGQFNALNSSRRTRNRAALASQKTAAPCCGLSNDYTRAWRWRPNHKRRRTTHYSFLTSAGLTPAEVLLGYQKSTTPFTQPNSEECAMPPPK